MHLPMDPLHRAFIVQAYLRLITSSSFTEDVWNLHVVETNRYADHVANSW